MRRLARHLCSALCAGVGVYGCAGDPPTSAARIVTDQEARLISIAREAAVARGFSLTDTIYEVRRDGNGWVVQVDRAPGYAGIGEPSIIVGGTFFVKVTAGEQVSEILTSRLPTTQPNGGE